jgi:aspartyl-tRNA(Asn)/glutamyl-tRNA(Gln) amidotransferase subunit A
VAGGGLMQVWELSAVELQELLVKRAISSIEIVKALYQHIERVEPEVKGFLQLNRERALQDAAEADACLRQGEKLTPLTGIPVAVKDNICVPGWQASCGSRILADFYPPYAATVIEFIKAAGGVVLGKTNMDEFAMGSSTENSAFYPTCNPWDLSRVPGGSSGGSAAVVAAREAPLALGSDTGGSIRQPAAFCGVTGLKPTYGLVSRYGLIAFASSLDQIGPLARSIPDLALLLQIIVGYDRKDSTSLPQEPHNFSLSSGEVKGKKLALVKEFMDEGLEAGIKALILKAAEIFASLGAEIVEVSLPYLKYALPAYYIIAPAEASSNLARYDGSRYGYRDFSAQDIVSMFKKTRQAGFGAEVKRRIIIGTYALSAGYFDAYYLKAQKVRTLIKQDFDNGFKQCDALLAPTTPTLPFKLGEKVNDPLQMYLSDIYTIAVNLAGLPGLVLPCGFIEDLPVGMQLIGKPWSEKLLLNLGYAFQETTDYHKVKPGIIEKAGFKVV